MTRIPIPTRLDLLPPEEVARQMELARATLLADTEIQRIRRSLSGIAARLTRKPERIEWAISKIEDELVRLRAIK